MGDINDRQSLSGRGWPNQPARVGPEYEGLHRILLQKAMEETERRTEEVRQSMLGDMDVEALMDQALRMAIINRTAGTAKPQVQRSSSSRIIRPSTKSGQALNTGEL